jgi:muramoyltetrapeptide carboxypeptidase LdcA involved in peptidoglycan recycling
MGLFIKPNKLTIGDIVATVSLSGGRAGDPDMLERYSIGKQRLEQIFGLRVVEMPNSMKGSQYLYENPKARADDLMEALQNPEIKGIFLWTNRTLRGMDSDRLEQHKRGTVDLD